MFDHTSMPGSPVTMASELDTMVTKPDIMITSTNMHWNNLSDLAGEQTGQTIRSPELRSPCEDSNASPVSPSGRIINHSASVCTAPPPGVEREKREAARVVVTSRQSREEKFPLVDLGHENVENFFSNVASPTSPAASQEDSFTPCPSPSPVKVNEEPTDSNIKNKPKEGGRKLWEFILGLLCAPETNPRVIKWLDIRQGVFKFERSRDAASLWGQRRGHPTMTYEHMSRAIRHYYKGQVILRVPGKRLVYQFGPRAKSWRQRVKLLTTGPLAEAIPNDFCDLQPVQEVTLKTGKGQRQCQVKVKKAKAKIAEGMAEPSVVFDKSATMETSIETMDISSMEDVVVMTTGKKLAIRPTNLPLNLHAGLAANGQAHCKTLRGNNYVDKFTPSEDKPLLQDMQMTPDNMQMSYANQTEISSPGGHSEFSTGFLNSDFHSGFLEGASVGAPSFPDCQVPEVGPEVPDYVLNPQLSPTNTSFYMDDGWSSNDYNKGCSNNTNTGGYGADTSRLCDGKKELPMDMNECDIPPGIVDLVLDRLQQFEWHEQTVLNLC